MNTYNKLTQYPINIKNRNPQMAKFIISQYGGPDGELAASLRYLSQRFSMPTEITKASTFLGLIIPLLYKKFLALQPIP